MAKTPPYPFLKWAGGKGRVASRILARLPESINTYYEPFLGGGAIFFELAKEKRFKRAVLSDMNPALINCWQVIQANVESLIRELQKSQYKYEKKTYLKIRAADISTFSDVQKAARTIYLNKTCFNGLYRVNSQGNFNVPFGKYSNPTICDESNLTAVSQALKGVEIKICEFNVAEKAKIGDAVYFDPPYLPISATSKFTAYTELGFGLEDHEKLAGLFQHIGKKGVRCVLSNSAAKKAIELYSDFDMDKFIGTRSVGGPVDFRKPAGEIIVFNGPKTK